MILIYNIAIRLYYFGILIASMWNAKARKWIKGRRNTDLETISRIRSKKPGLIWFHCASVGEYEQALPLIHKCRMQFPNHELFTTFYSPSGFEYAGMKYPGALISYLPLDTKKNMSAFAAALKPDLVFIIKYEFWYHLLESLHSQKVPVFLVSGIFRKQQAFFKPWGILHKRMLRFFTCIFVQDESSKTLLQTINITNVLVAGDTRFDRVAEIRDTAFDDQVLNAFLTTDQVFVAGSVWESDIPVLKAIISSLPPDWKIILAPHEIDHFRTKWIGEPVSRYTAGGSVFSDRILLIDTVGILSRIYRFAQFVYIGGGFGKGIHNILEPVVYEKPVLIGENYHKFKEATDLVRKGAVFSVNPENAESIVKNIILDKNKYMSIASQLKSYIAANTNLSEKILVYVQRYLKA